MRRALPLILTAALVLAGCSDGEAPEWLVEQATSTTAPTPTTTTVPPSTTVPEPGRDLAAVDLQAGQCIEDASAFTARQVSEITRTRAIPCRLPHQAEVYLRVDLPAGPNARFPGIGALRQQAQQRCRDDFQGFVGIRWTRSELEIATLWPSPESWPQGDRLLVCVVFRLDGGPLTGSARGSRL